jgi:hypothetical protein
MHRFDSFVPVVDGATEHSEFESLLGRLGQRDRQAVERHVAVCEAESSPAHASLWRRMACLLAALASRSSAPGADDGKAAQTSRQFGVQTSGQKAVQFFAPDGKYRRQVFALEDLRDGVLSVYAVDALAAALRAGALRGPVKAEGPAAAEGSGGKVYELCGGDGNGTVRVEAITASTLGSAPDYYRHMVGWNRTALKVTMATTASDDDVRALGVLFALAGRQVTGTT